MTESLDEPVRFLDWDSDFFKKRIGRVIAQNMSDQGARSVDEWAAEHCMDCLYFLADGNSVESSWEAEAHGFHLMDLRVTYQNILSEKKSQSQNFLEVRKAVQSDLPFLKQMAGDYHHISRFYADEHFSHEKCSELYKLWIERDFNEKDHFLWVFDQDGELAGYTSASIDRENDFSEIGLVGVNSKLRGQGIGLKLQLAVLEQLYMLGIQQVEVVTQGRNIGAQNLYIKSGYELKSIDLWYHKWYS